MILTTSQLNFTFRKELTTMRDFLKRCKNELYGLQIDLMLDLQKHKQMLQTTYGISAGVGAIAGLVTMACADDGLSKFQTNVTEQITKIYSAAFGIITAIAALLLLIAFAIRMTGEPQKAAQATNWITRIIVTYIAINCIGMFFTVMKSITAGMNTNNPALNGTTTQTPAPTPGA